MAEAGASHAALIEGFGAAFVRRDGAALAAAAKMFIG